VLVVSDTTALTTLLKAGEEDLLQRLFGNVCIPVAVARELRRFHKHLPDFLQVREIADRSRHHNSRWKWMMGRLKSSVSRWNWAQTLCSWMTVKVAARRRKQVCTVSGCRQFCSRPNGRVSWLHWIFFCDGLKPAAIFRLKDSVRARLLLEAAE
jgi:hypothetical protein